MEIVCLNFNPQSTLLATGSMDHTSKVLMCAVVSASIMLHNAGLITCACARTSLHTGTSPKACSGPPVQ
jgi:hypothetical protein